MPTASLAQLIRDALNSLDERGDGGLIPAVIEIFLRDVPERLERLRRAGGRGDATTFQTEVHALRMAASELGAIPLIEILRRLERDAQEGALPRDESTVDQLEREFEVTARELKKHRDQD